jgi:hypothetical protein
MDSSAKPLAGKAWEAEGYCAATLWAKAETSVR